MARRKTTRGASRNAKAAPKAGAAPDTAAEDATPPVEDADTTPAVTPPEAEGGDAPAEEPPVEEAVVLDEPGTELSTDVAAKPPAKLSDDASATEIDFTPDPALGLPDTSEGDEHDASVVIVEPDGAATVEGGEAVPEATDRPAAETGGTAAAPDTPRDLSDGPEPEASPPATVPPVVPPPQVVERRGPGFVPLLLGGLLAGGIGWLIATMTVPDASEIDTGRIAAVEGELDTLRADLDSVPPAPDLSALEAAQGNVLTRLDALDARVDDVSAPDDRGAPVDLGPIRAELAALREAVAPLSDRIAALEAQGDGDAAARIDALEADLSARIDALAAAAQNAETGARAAARDALGVAVRAGTPYADLTDELDDLPPALADRAEAGVPTEASLAEDFPPLAREALRAARAAGEGSEAGLSGFLRTQLGARSLEPREGADPDAVLSRAEAAVRTGEVAAALQEIEALPAVSRDVLSDWEARARAHVEAQAALTDYLEG